MRVNQVRNYEGVWFASVTTDVVAENDFDEVLVRLLDHEKRVLLETYQSVELVHLMVSPPVQVSSLSFTVLENLDATGVRVVLVFSHGERRTERRYA